MASHGLYIIKWDINMNTFRLAYQQYIIITKESRHRYFKPCLDFKGYTHGILKISTFKVTQVRAKFNNQYSNFVE